MRPRKKSRSCARKSQTRAAGNGIVDLEGGGCIPTLDRVGVRARRSLRRGRRRRVVQGGALDLADLVGLDQVAFLDVVEALEVDAALEALGQLAHVVLEALQRVDRGLVDDGAVTDDPRA